MKPKLSIQSSPWGAVQSEKLRAPGLVFVSTASHGGFSCSPDRWAHLMHEMPDFQSFAGPEWLEEDCDALAVYVLWPDEFEPCAVFHAVRFAFSAQSWATAAGSMSRFLARGSDAAKRARLIADEFRASVADHWETGSLCTCRGGLSVTMRHVTTREAREIIFPAYPAKQFYTASELDGFKPALVKGGAQ